MEKLNEYIQALLSNVGYELHLEPNKAPYIVSETGNTDVSNAALLGAQISTMIFPLIPNEVKRQLPHKQEVDFQHEHLLGSFNFQVKKSPAGFMVTIRPTLSKTSQSNGEAIEPAKIESVSPAPAPAQSEIEITPDPTPAVPTVIEAQSFQFENFKPPEDPVPAVKDEVIANDAILSHAPTVVEQTVETAPEKEEEAEPSGLEVSASAEAVPNIEVETSNDAPEPAIPAEVLSANSEKTEQRKPADVVQTKPEEAPTVIETTPMFKEEFRSPVENFPQPISAEKASQPAEPKKSVVFNPQARARMDALFQQMAEAGASDLHVSTGMPPLIRKDGKMRPLNSSHEVLSATTNEELLTSIMPAKNLDEFYTRHDTDFAYELPGLGRFRSNVFMDRKGMGGVFRLIPSEILTAEQLRLSQAIMNLCTLSKGLVVVTGPTGSGKSTTLCAMVDHINKSREEHIITIEDPIEFVHENQKCLINQREVHNHTDSFKNALRAALREDPDILLVGEMRDLETIAIAIETAETGHLVFGTLHTTTAASTIDRIIDQFPADQQQQIRVMLSESLKGVIAQSLLPKKGGGRVAAMEVLIITHAISNMIREGKTFQIGSAMQTGKAQGMVTLNDSLLELVKNGSVEARDAHQRAIDRAGFEALLEKNGLKL